VLNGKEWSAMPTVVPRLVDESDLDGIFEQMRDPVSVQMAAFTTEDPNDRAAFDSHMAKTMSSPDVTVCAITCDDRLVGTIGRFVLEGVTEVTCWLDRSSWGKGIASRALELLLEDVSVRPVPDRVGSDNVGSLRVLQKAGFETVGTEVSYALARDAEIEETILELS
jgi:RimJ/RimL family protein N-acetyltransferase